jgi:putative sigma-54 modulation protein
MIEKIDITAQRLELTDDLKKYVNKKIGRLDHYMSRHVKKSVYAEVKLKEESSKKNDQFTAEVIIHLPNEKIAAKDSTLNIFAAIDIVEAKLKNQLLKYKGKTGDHKADRKGVLAKFKRKADKDFWGSQN